MTGLKVKDFKLKMISIEKEKLYPFFLMFLFLIFLTIIEIFLGLAINFIYETFSLKFLKISFINSFFLSLGIIFNLFISRMLFKKISNILLLILAVFIIFGINLLGFIYLFFTETFFFIYESNLINAYLLVNFLFSIALSVITTGFIIYQRTSLENKKILNEEKLLRARMEQELYKSKINPHFLFNTLNMIISLLKDPEKAEHAMLSLSELLRFNLSASGKEKIRIRDEIKSIEKYLYIQKLRFEERLSYKISCTENFFVPPLLLQPLVENSIKHNIDEKEKLFIGIKVSKTGKNNIIEIRDSFGKINETMFNRGMGLSITRDRVLLAGGEFIIKDGGITIKL
jgi:two-component system, LytTR family, sensor kinase